LATVRKVAKAGKSDAAKKDDADFGSSEDEDADEDKYADAADQVGQKLDAKTRITVRNLRIREDTAKYLINLDPESAYYDPKTRSMRDAPVKNVPPEDVHIFLTSIFKFVLTIYTRPSLLVITSSVSLEKQKKCSNSNFLLGRLLREATMFTSMLTPHKESCYIMISGKKRRSSKTR
jgi:hypothetical protein